MSEYRVYRGHPLPLGAIPASDGINFSLLCRHGTDVWLVLMPADEEGILTELFLHPRKNRTGDHWHIRVAGLPNAFRYGWRVDGPRGGGHRFDPSIILLDPAATMLSDGAVWGASSEANGRAQVLAAAAVGGRDCAARSTSSTTSLLRSTSRRSLFSRGPRYDWQEDAPPLVPFEDSIIYELHVRGFTCHPSSGVQHPGTFIGLIEKIPYLKWLGVTAVELLPIHEFDENDCPFSNPETGEPLRNFWGYNSIAFAAPKAAYAATGAQHGAVNEFREMVKKFHESGIEVILDVVFNHTGEGDHRGRTYSFRGLDNELYYMLSPDGCYLNFSGCGNTMNCNHPVVRQLLMNCLRYWVADMHVDGLRFDLASILGRDRWGNVLVEPPIIETIAEDGVLADTKLIAEPWDAAGLYQVGNFPYGRRWSEWNGRYRDDVRRFWKGDPGMAGALATRVSGSADLYEGSGRQPRHSINFITCHDGFTLNDLVSYNHKHNIANGEDNRDGCNNNHSWNCGVEGNTDDPMVLGLRRRQTKNLIATLMLSQGVPMLLAGDEFLRSQQGNNNAWCQDNELSWLNWDLCNQNADFLRFVREMIHLRRRHPILRRRRFFQGERARPGGAEPWSANGTPSPHRPPEGWADVAWHGIEPRRPDFSASSRSLAFTLDGRLTGREPDQDFYVACNAWCEALPFRVPPSPSRRPWRRVVDTALASPLDVVDELHGPFVPEASVYLVAPYALVVLISEP